MAVARPGPYEYVSILGVRLSVKSWCLIATVGAAIAVAAHLVLGCEVVTGESTMLGVKMICNEPCKYTAWGDWGKCDATCGDGTQTRHRSLAGGSHAVCTRLTDTQTCIVKQCGCTYKKWTDWGECSEPCGGGQRTRTRELADNSPKNCAAGAVSDTEPCHTQRCDSSVGHAFYEINDPNVLGGWLNGAQKVSHTDTIIRFGSTVHTTAGVRLVNGESLALDPGATYIVHGAVSAWLPSNKPTLLKFRWVNMDTNNGVGTTCAVTRHPAYNYHTVCRATITPTTSTRLQLRVIKVESVIEPVSMYAGTSLSVTVLR